jgi:nitrous oxidase accessory protein NosD
MAICNSRDYNAPIPRISRLLRTHARALGLEKETQMKKFPLLFLLACLVVCFAARPALAQDANKTPNILVDDNKKQCPTAGFTSIQAAVNAAKSGDLIRVCAGTYHEQVVIEKSLSLEADNGVTVIPSAVVANAAGLSSGDPIAAIILVRNADDVDLQGFIVDGSANGLTGCGPTLIGILYQDASGSIEHNFVRQVRLGSTLPGCQSGNAIDVESSSSGQSNVTIADNSVDAYQKNGITANEPGTRVVVTANAVTGLGPTTGAAQNGIQIGFGAHGRVTKNAVADNVYSPCESAANCPSNAAGILIFQSDGVRVERNTLGSNQVGVFVAANNGNIGGNTIFHSVALDGIALVGNGNSVSSNDISSSDDAAVFIQGNDNTVFDNEFTGAAFGIFKLSSASGTNHYGNQYFATVIRVLDPAPTKSLTPSPSR